MRFEWSGRAVGVNQRLQPSARGRRLMLTAKYRAFKDALYYTFLPQWRNARGVKMVDDVTITMTQASRHDCDALVKPVIDALVKVGVMHNDSQVVHICIHRVPKRGAEDQIEVDVAEQGNATC